MAKMSLEKWSRLRHFHTQEIWDGKSAWGNHQMMEDEFMFLLDEYRHRLGKGFIPHYGYRLNSENHAAGKAVDGHVAHVDLFDLYVLAERMGFTGIGLYDWGIHLDTNHKLPARWVKILNTGIKSKDYVSFHSENVDYIRGKYMFGVV
jgi:hypothetical protein